MMKDKRGKGRRTGKSCRVRLRTIVRYIQHVHVHVRICPFNRCADKKIITSHVGCACAPLFDTYSCTAGKRERRTVGPVARDKSQLYGGKACASRPGKGTDPNY